MRRLAAALLCLATFGCATVGHGPYQRIEVDSVPETEVLLENCGHRAPESVITPALVTVSRRATKCRLIFAPGTDAEEVVQLRRQVSPDGYLRSFSKWCGDGAWNCSTLDDVFIAGSLGLFFFLPSVAVDAITGALFEQDPQAVIVEVNQ